MSELNGHAKPLEYDDRGDLEPKWLPVKIRGQDYVLRQAMTGATVRYRNALQRGQRLDREGGFIEFVEGVSDAEPLIVSLCLFRVIQVGATRVEEPVDREFVDGLSPNFVGRLFEDLSRISPGLVRTGRRDEDELPKASPPGTTTSSG
jgi:hypothetical protein